MTCANRVKAGLVSSGTMSPTRLEVAVRTRVGRSYPRSSMATRTASRAASDTPGRPLRTRLTVAVLTFARSAMSCRRTGTGRG